MKLIVTLDISDQVAAKELITLNLLRTFAEELKADALKTIPQVNVTVEALP